MKVIDKYNKGTKDVLKINNSWWINSTIRSAVTSKEIGKIAADLLGISEIRLWHDQAICKPGGVCEGDSSGNIGWHQDYAFCKHYYFLFFKLNHKMSRASFKFNKHDNCVDCFTRHKRNEWLFENYYRSLLKKK